MGKQTAQGTRWETKTKHDFRKAGRWEATRTPKTGKANEPDVIVPGKHMRPVLLWENWVKRPGKRRRSARLAVISYDHYMELVALDKTGKFGYYVQNKSTQALSVRAVFEGLVQWMIQERNHESTE